MNYTPLRHPFYPAARSQGKARISKGCTEDGGRRGLSLASLKRELRGHLKRASGADDRRHPETCDDVREGWEEGGGGDNYGVGDLSAVTRDDRAG